MTYQFNPYAIVDESAYVASTAVLGEVSPRLQGSHQLVDFVTPCRIDANVWIGDYCVVGRGVHIGKDTVLEPMAAVMEGTQLGSRTVLACKAHVGPLVRIGDECIIGGSGHGSHATICSGSVIESGCKVFGSLLHRVLDPSLFGGIDAGDAGLAPVLEQYAFIGHGATVIGGVNVGAGAYVVAGAIVTKDVPPGLIVKNSNEHIRPEDWTGELGEHMLANMIRPT